MARICGLRLKPITLSFIVAEACDGITTYLGIKYANAREFNVLMTLPVLIVFKVLTTLGISVILERKKLNGNYWIIPLVASLPVFWNSFIILLEIYFKG